MIFGKKNDTQEIIYTFSNVINSSFEPFFPVDVGFVAIGIVIAINVINIVVSDLRSVISLCFMNNGAVIYLIGWKLMMNCYPSGVFNIIAPNKEFFNWKTDFSYCVCTD